LERSRLGDAGAQFGDHRAARVVPMDSAEIADF
jgi:hypothetical protein